MSEQVIWNMMHVMDEVAREMALELSPEEAAGWVSYLMAALEKELQPQLLTSNVLDPFDDFLCSVAADIDVRLIEGRW
jgi:hypothetical protein